jgi:hypothetical protein
MDVILKFIYLALCAYLLKKNMTLVNGLCDRTLHWKMMGMVVQINQLLLLFCGTKSIYFSLT